ncbi:MAG TPA: hypothetical protein PLP23_22935 [Panacibacter sp.]|nr:hypothetical protein [Panacibacter sp.]
MKVIMDKYYIIEDIIFMPKKSKEEDMSVYSLLKKSGYFKFHREINEIDIFEVLSKTPECVSQWLAWSEDKRTGPGWHFEKTQSEKYYIVSHYPPKTNLKPIVSFDKIAACAAFIKKEIERIRKS